MNLLCVYFNDKRNNFVLLLSLRSKCCMCAVCLLFLCVSFFRLTYTPVKQHKCEQPFTVKLYDALVESLTETLYQTCTMYTDTHTHNRTHKHTYINFLFLRCFNYQANSVIGLSSSS